MFWVWCLCCNDFIWLVCWFVELNLIVVYTYIVYTDNCRWPMTRWNLSVLHGWATRCFRLGEAQGAQPAGGPNSQYWPCAWAWPTWWEWIHVCACEHILCSYVIYVYACIYVHICIVHIKVNKYTNKSIVEFNPTNKSIVEYIVDLLSFYMTCLCIHTLTYLLICWVCGVFFAVKNIVCCSCHR